MIKPFNILQETIRDDGTMVLYNATKTTMADSGAVTKKTITSTIFVETGLDIEQELVKNLRQGGWI